MTSVEIRRIKLLTWYSLSQCVIFYLILLCKILMWTIFIVLFLLINLFFIFLISIYSLLLLWNSLILTWILSWDRFFIYRGYDSIQWYIILIGLHYETLLWLIALKCFTFGVFWIYWLHIFFLVQLLFEARLHLHWI